MVPEAEKPEWFEIADSDNSTAPASKVNKKLPIVAVLVTGAVIGAGAFFANASESNANAESSTQTTAPVTSNSSPGVADPSSAPSAGMQSPGTATDPTQGGIQAPHGRGDRDGDHQFGDGDGHGRGGEFHDGDHERD